ncbi:MAG: hypothetical protein JXA60_05600 [Candidatus Coatesbacteria bacterium]|nr:hypothetical protein [Candidatus Coatesbacteria bacterium]
MEKSRKYSICFFQEKVFHDIGKKALLIYLGLQSLADCWGMVTNDVFLIKNLLSGMFDAEEIEEAIDIMERSGLLEKVNNQDCYFLKNFHKHQRPIIYFEKLPDFIPTYEILHSARIAVSKIKGMESYNSAIEFFCKLGYIDDDQIDRLKFPGNSPGITGEFLLGKDEVLEINKEGKEPSASLASDPVPDNYSDPEILKEAEQFMRFWRDLNLTGEANLIDIAKLIKQDKWKDWKKILPVISRHRCFRTKTNPVTLIQLINSQKTNDLAIQIYKENRPAKPSAKERKIYVFVKELKSYVPVSREAFKRLGIEDIEVSLEVLREKVPELNLNLEPQKIIVPVKGMRSIGEIIEEKINKDL